jgi:hypothetical protein
MNCRFTHIGLFAIVFTSLLAGSVTAAPPSDAIVTAQVSADEALAQANIQVDLAEHNLAAARRSFAPNTLSLANERRTSGEQARVEFCKRDLRTAHQNLANVLRQRATQPTFTSPLNAASDRATGQS